MDVKIITVCSPDTSWPVTHNWHCPGLLGLLNSVSYPKELMHYSLVPSIKNSKCSVRNDGLKSDKAGKWEPPESKRQQ
ncbi:hypothetical protein NQZ68_012465 [Dissostichus eleginoides]|nr:hypothetical protein NQZ68_012465 [Dissostichus eleginoides]